MSLAYFDLLFTLFGLIVVLETRMLGAAVPHASVTPAIATAHRLAT